MDNLYHVHHLTQSLSDFTNDCHRFIFNYNGSAHFVRCIGNVSIFFDDEKNIPENVQLAIQNQIYYQIDHFESTWPVPKEAERIAEEYCKQEFIR